MDALLQDLRFGLRMLVKSPGSSALVALTFALGIGVNLVIFSVADAVAFRPLGVAHADRIVRILNRDATHPERGDESSWMEVAQFRTETRAFAAIAAADRRGVVVKDRDEAHRLIVNVVSDTYFDVFQVNPAAGRTFSSAELRGTDSSPLVLLSYDYWQRQYQGAPQIVGRTIVASDVACRVLGVLPRTFRGTELSVDPDLYLPVSTWLAMNPGDRVRLERPQARQLEVFGRLQAGVTPAQAAAALGVVQDELVHKYAQYESGRRLDVKFERDTRGAQVQTIGTLLLAVAAIVLAIACVNIANLLVVRGEVRRREMVTRIALGASRRRTVRQLVTETLLLTAIGAGGAVLVASWIVGALPLLLPPSESSVGFDFRFDWRVLAFGAGASFVCVVLAGVLPALATTDVAIATDLKASAVGRGGRWRDFMVTGQVAITVLLLVASGLLVRTLMAIRDLDPGFNARGPMLIASLDVRKLDLPREHAYYRAMLERVGAMPGVEGAAVASRIPLWSSGGGAAMLAWVPGLPQTERDGVRIGFAVVSPNYFSTLGTRMVRGRPIAAQDSPDSALAVVLNQTAARLLWPNDDPIGKHLRLNGATGRDVEVVGVAQDGRYLQMTEDQRAYMFLPLFQEVQIFGSRWGADVVVVRAGNAAAQAAAVRAALHAIDPDVVLLSMTTMDEHVRGALYGDRLTAQLVGAMGALGLLLAAIGLFGVISYSVARRTREIALRVALGAPLRSVVRLVLGRALLLAGAGIVSGMALAFLVGRALSSMVYGVSPRDPFTMLAAAVTMALVALLAAAGPARRAVRVDPIEALRSE